MTEDGGCDDDDDDALLPFRAAPLSITEPDPTC